MNRKQRLHTALHLGQPDRVPMFDFLFQQPLYEALIGHRPAFYNARDAVDCALALDHDGVWIPFGAPTGYVTRFLAEDTYLDEWGTTYRRTPASWPLDAPIAYPIASRDDLRGWTPPDPAAPGRSDEIASVREMATDGLSIMGGVGGPFTMAWMLMGYERLALTVYDDPGLLTELMRIITDYAREAARLSVAAGCDCLWISDDLGDSTHEFLRLEQFRRLVLPYLAELAEYIDGLGVPALLHSCGHISGYLDDLAQTKLAAIHPLQRTAGMDLRTVKERYGHRFCLIGNIDSSRTLPYGTPEEVAAEVREAIDIAAPGGGYILASDHSLHDGIPVPNALALFQTGAEYGGRFYR
jgi:uroporphyrinogen decarboxylase